MNKVAIFSVPRSGSTWLGQLLNSHPNVLYRFQPNFAYSFGPELEADSSPEEISIFFDELAITDDDFVNGRISISSKKNIEFEKEAPTSLVFKETHYLNVIENLLKNSDAKVIGLVRSPFAVINSWLKIPKEFDPNWDIKSQWETGSNKNQGRPTHYFGYNKWKEATQLFLQLKEEYPNRFFLAEYEKMLTDPEAVIKKVFGFCGLSFSNQTQEFLRLSSRQNDDDPYAVLKKKKDDLQWKASLPQHIIDKIDKDNDFAYLNNIFNWV